MIDCLILRLELLGKRKRGRPKRRFMSVVRAGIIGAVMMEDAEDRRRNK